ncbi:MAG: substrate-binding domain-containing protein [Candidatus Delongbacteria bacterium]
MKLAQLLALGLVAGLTLAGGAAAREIRIGAGAAPTENVLKPVKAAFEKATGHTLTILATGPKNALADLDKGLVEAAAAGLSLEDWLALMKKENVEVADPAGLKAVVIGQDKIRVLVHKDNPVKTLSREQLKGLFTGSLDNWQAVGGADAPVIVVWGSLIPGTNSLFQKNMLEGAAPGGNLLEATTAEDVRQIVASNPEAIGIGPLAILDASVASPDTPEVARPITLLSRGNPSPELQQLLDFIAKEGPALIRQ